MKRLASTPIVTLLLLLAPAAAAAAAGGEARVETPVRPHTIANSQVRVLPRSANGRDYQLHVGLPPSYEAQPGRRYPVLYVCDGYWDFALIASLAGGLLYDHAIPEFILVGFGYPGPKPAFDTLRTYDYTPVPAPNDPKANLGGHAAEFLRVVETELIPFIEREYRVDPSFRALGGSSLGGLFTLYAMLERPGLFHAYIAPSPAVDWANGWLFGREAAFAAAHKELKARLFMSGASEEWPKFLAAVKRFNDTLQTRRYAGLQYKWRLVDGERHAGTKPESYNRGIRFVFAPLATSPSDK
jgi:predicted alpha/beta superfamily hydrolase